MNRILLVISRTKIWVRELQIIQNLNKINNSLHKILIFYINIMIGSYNGRVKGSKGYYDIVTERIRRIGANVISKTDFGMETSVNTSAIKEEELRNIENERIIRQDAQREIENERIIRQDAQREIENKNINKGFKDIRKTVRTGQNVIRNSISEENRERRNLENIEKDRERTENEKKIFFENEKKIKHALGKKKRRRANKKGNTRRKKK